MENKINELLEEIENLEIELENKLEELYDNDKIRIVEYKDYIIQKMPDNFFDGYGEVNPNFELECEDEDDYECCLESYVDILEEEMECIEEELNEELEVIE